MKTTRVSADSARARGRRRIRLGVVDGDHHLAVRQPALVAEALADLIRT